jgi:hypothetical protein
VLRFVPLVERSLAEKVALAQAAALPRVIGRLRAMSYLFGAVERIIR